MGFCAYKMKLEACYAHSRIVMGVIEQSRSEQKAGSTVYVRSSLHYARNRHNTRVKEACSGFL